MPDEDDEEDGVLPDAVPELLKVLLFVEDLLLVVEPVMLLPALLPVLPEAEELLPVPLPEELDLSSELLEVSFLVELPVMVWPRVEVPLLPVEPLLPPEVVVPDDVPVLPEALPEAELLPPAVASKLLPVVPERVALLPEELVLPALPPDLEPLVAEDEPSLLSSPPVVPVVVLLEEEVVPEVVPDVVPELLLLPDVVPFTRNPASMVTLAVLEFDIDCLTSRLSRTSPFESMLTVALAPGAGERLRAKSPLPLAVPAVVCALFCEDAAVVPCEPVVVPVVPADPERVVVLLPVVEGL